jgi:hypothetical protein
VVPLWQSPYQAKGTNRTILSPVYLITHKIVKIPLMEWSNIGMDEGHVTRLKLIKMQGYGRAGFPLLRKQVLHAF